MDYREMKLMVYGQLTNGQLKLLKMKLYINNNEYVCSSQIATGDFEFRVDEELTDYFPVEQHYKIFNESLRVKVEFTIEGNAENATVIFNSDVKLFPNDHTSFEAKKYPGFIVRNLIFKLSCHGFTGYNCQFALKNTDTLTTDFITGYDVCKDMNNCLPVDQKCENNLCQNNGQCFIDSASGEAYCVCLPGFAGSDCGFVECAFDEDELMFGDKENLCDSKPCKDDINPCKNNGTCQLYGLYFIHCTCDKRLYTGKHCEKQCEEECPEDSYCTEDDDGEGPYCYPTLKNPSLLYGSYSSPILAERPCRGYSLFVQTLTILVSCILLGESINTWLY